MKKKKAGKHEICHILLCEEAKLNNCSSTGLEILYMYVNRFSSDLVHRHIIFLLTLLLK